MLSKVHRLSLKNWSCTTWVVPIFLLVQYNRVLCWTHRQSAGRPTLLAKNGNLPLVRKQHSFPTDGFTSAILCPPNLMTHRHLCPSTTIEKRIVLRLSNPESTAGLHLWNWRQIIVRKSLVFHTAITAILARKFIKTWLQSLLWSPLQAHWMHLVQFTMFNRALR